PSPTTPVITEPSPTAVPSAKPSPTMSPTTNPPTIDDSPFVIDGMEQDWQDYSALATSNSNVKALKAVIKEGTLYVLISGQLLKEKGQLYVRSNQTSNSYFAVPHWSDQQADYLIENGILYQYVGSGKNWSWKK